MANASRTRWETLAAAAGCENEALGREFLESPEAFTKNYGIQLKDMACPDAVHDALKRGEAFAAEARERVGGPSPESMSVLKEIAPKHFGSGYIVSLIPFGLRFREPLKSGPPDLTATGTVNITFCDSGADTDV